MVHPEFAHYCLLAHFPGHCQLWGGVNCRVCADGEVRLRNPIYLVASKHLETLESAWGFCYCLLRTE